MYSVREARIRQVYWIVVFNQVFLSHLLGEVLSFHGHMPQIGSTT